MTAMLGMISAATPRPAGMTGVFWIATGWRECFAVIDATNAATGAYDKPAPGNFTADRDLTGDEAICACDAHDERRATPMTGPELACELIESAAVNERGVVWQETISPLCDEIVRLALAEDYAETSAQFPGEEIRIDDVGAPYVHVREGRWELRYFPPAAIEVHHGGQMVRAWSLYTDDGIPIDRLSAVTMGDLRARLTRYLVDG